MRKSFSNASFSNPTPMNQQPFFSIIVPCYNVEKYLSYAIDSVLNQPFSNWELVLINDGSTDDTKNIIEDYTHKDARIKAIHKLNGGVSIARNAGLDIATGKWILFLDSDDWFEKDAFEKLNALIDQYHDADIIGFNHFYNSERREWKRENIIPDRIIRADDEIKYFKLDTLFPYYDKRTNGVSTGAIRGVWGKAFKRELIKNNQIQFETNIKIGEDAIFCLDTFNAAKKIVLCNEYLIHYRVFQESTMNKYNAAILYINEQSLNGYYQRIKNLLISGDRDYKICFCGMAAECLFRTFRLYLLHHDCTLSFSEKKRIIREMLQSHLFQIAFDCNLNYLPSGKKELVYCAKHGMINLLFAFAYISCAMVKIRKR